MNASDAGFLTHLEALRQVLWRSVAAVGVLLVPGFFAAPEVLGFLVRFTCPPDFKLNYFTPMEPLIVQLKLGLFLAVVAAMPVILRQAARFVAPALYEHERRAAGRAVAAATLLFLAGAAVGLFLVVPLMMKFSAAYASESLAPVIGIGSFVNLVGLLALSFGVMFQLPVVMVLLVRCGVVEVGTLKRSRPLAVTVIFILAALLSPPGAVRGIRRRKNRRLPALPCRRERLRRWRKRAPKTMRKLRWMPFTVNPTGKNGAKIGDSA